MFGTRRWTLDRRSGLRSAVALVLAVLALPAIAQFPDVLAGPECPGCGGRSESAAFAGTWSSALTAAAEPGWALADFYCFAACTAEGRAEAERLLAGRETAHRSALELYPLAVAANVRSVLRVAVVAANPLRPPDAGLPGLSCDAAGLVGQVVSPLPLEIATTRDRVLLRYEEHGVERAIPLDGAGGNRAAASTERTSFGASMGHFERGVLVIETSNVPPGRLSGWLGGFGHSGALRAVERYSVSADGRWLDLELTLHDPATLVGPLVVTKRWLRTPRARLAHHGCDVMSAGLGGTFAEYLDPRFIEARRNGASAD